MDFKEQLSEYIQLLDCTANDLAKSSRLSAATISRYRSGERIPEAGSKNLDQLTQGIVQLAKEKGIPEITPISVAQSFAPLVKNSSIDFHKLQINFDTLLTLLSVNISELSRSLNYDSSYISRIKNGQRQPASPQEFARNVAAFIACHYQKISEKELLARLIDCDIEELKHLSDYEASLAGWLLNGYKMPKDSMTGFLEKLDAFDLNEYIRAVHFDEWKVPAAHFQLPTSRNYFGLKEMMDSELAFLKATVLSKSMDAVIMYSDMPMSEMAKDPDFPKKWMFGMAMMLKKGLHLNQIHNIDRSLEDMMLGLESWIPMYMTGQISPWYLKDTQDSAFSHLLKVSGSAALVGEAIRGHHSDGKYYLTKNKEEVLYYQKQARHLLAKASPLMEIYRQDRARDYYTFLQMDAKTEGSRQLILSSLSLYTANDALIRRILQKNGVEEQIQLKILTQIARQRLLIQEILSHSTLIEEVPLLSEDEFRQSPVVLPLSNLFYEKDIYYQWEDYQEHLQQMNAFQQQYPNYSFHQNPSSAFRNIQIYIHEGKWVIVSKNKAPAVHFLIRHPKMRHAFEHMTIPIMDAEDSEKI